MSLLAGIFGWTRLPQWGIELLVIAGLAGGFWLYHQHVYDTGIHAQQAADQKASAVAIDEAHTQSVANQAAADAAHDAWMREKSDENTAVSVVPLPAVRLCIDAHVGGSSVSKAGAPDVGNAGASATTRNISGMPLGAIGLRQERSGPDVGSLLDAWAQKADSVSATLREFQSRGH